MNCTPPIAPSKDNKPSAGKKPRPPLNLLRKATTSLVIFILFACNMVRTAEAMDNDGVRFQTNANGAGNLAGMSQIVIDTGAGNTFSNLNYVSQFTADVAGHVIGQASFGDFLPAGDDAHAVWRDIVSSSVASLALLGGIATKEFSHTTNVPKLVGTYSAIQLEVMIWQTMRFHLQYAMSIFLQRRGWDPQKAKWASMATLASCNLGFATLITYQTGLLDDFFLNPKRRDLLGLNNGIIDLEAGIAGNHMKEIIYALSQARYDAEENRIYLQPMPGCNYVQTVEMPTAQFGDDVTLPLVNFRWIVDQTTGKSEWVRVADISLNSNVYNTLPVKVIADGDRVWKLSKRVGNGFDIFYQPQYSGVASARGAVNWTRISGEVIDIAPGPNYVWGTNKEHLIYKCTQPCNGEWTMTDGYADTVAVGAGMTVDGQTDGQPLFVWVKTGNGEIYRRPENGDGTWQFIGRSAVPERIQNQLDERNSYDDWLNDKKYNIVGYSY